MNEAYSTAQLGFGCKPAGPYEARSRGCLTWICLLGVACDLGQSPTPSAARSGHSCGNGIVEEAEACDLGFANGPEAPCRTDCVLPRCGDGVQDVGEACDDGNDDDHDACRLDCTRPLRSQWVRMPVGGRMPEGVRGLWPLSDGVAVAGYGQSQTGTSTRAWLATYATDGELRWQRHLLDDDDTWESAVAAAVVVDDAGDLWVAGHVSGDNDDDVWVARCEPDGTPRWHYFGDLGGNRDRASALTLIEGGVAVAGDVVRSETNRDGVVLGLDADGAQTFFWRYDGATEGIDDARAIVATPDGGMVVAGGENNLTGWWLAKLDEQAEPIGYSRGSGAVGAWISALAVDTNGELYAAGTEVLAAPDPGQSVTWHTQPFVARFDSMGTMRWKTVEPPSGAVRREAFAVAIDPDGGATMVGTDPIPLATCTRRLCAGRLWLASVDVQGQRRHLAVPDSMPIGEGHAVARAADGALWLGGNRRVPLSESDAWIGRYEETERAEKSP